MWSNYADCGGNGDGGVKGGGGSGGRSDGLGVVVEVVVMQAARVGCGAVQRQHQIIHVMHICAMIIIWTLTPPTTANTASADPTCTTPIHTSGAVHWHGHGHWQQQRMS